MKSAGKLIRLVARHGLWDRYNLETQTFPFPRARLQPDDLVVLLEELTEPTNDGNMFRWVFVLSPSGVGFVELTSDELHHEVG